MPRAGKTLAEADGDRSEDVDLLEWLVQETW